LPLTNDVGSPACEEKKKKKRGKGEKRCLCPGSVEFRKKFHKKKENTGRMILVFRRPKKEKRDEGKRRMFSPFEFEKLEQERVEKGKKREERTGES